MRACAFLTLEDSSGYVIDDGLAIAPLGRLGWRVESIPWRRPDVDWTSYDAVVIRSTWDYVKDPGAFLDVLGRIESAGAALFNRLDLVRWNLRKTYLRDLAERGVAIVPTLWGETFHPGQLDELLEQLGTVDAVIKPIVGASASDVLRVTAHGGGSTAADIAVRYGGKPFMLQPYLASVETEGEFSLFYFDGEYSHAVVKRPKANDFRVQEEHGGSTRAFEPGETLLAAGSAVLRALDEMPLYARVDLVRAADRRGFWLMELELVEPALYLRTNAMAPEHFARALHRRATGLARVPNARS